ncbi:DoxX family protein [Halocatena marina]|uniref:DoxX family protein n=1 Tax=Halocatena marina TaxID=2934937 RepID=UPI00200ECD9F|nr:DoxX family protein [Halocatena marina]
MGERNHQKESNERQTPDSIQKPGATANATNNTDSKSPYLVMPFLIFLVTCFILRALGTLGVETVDSWHTSVRVALAVMFIFTSTTHFTSNRDALVRMVPHSVPYPKQVVTVTGIAELVGAVGLLWPVTDRIAGFGLAALLVVLFPANIVAVRNEVAIHGKPPTPLWIRLPIQLVWIASLLWVTW